MSRRTRLILCLAAFTVFCGAYRDRGYNIVLIYVDGLRADQLGCYGRRVKTSPQLDALAAQGCLFENNFSTASFTCASFTSINTSLYPRSHGVLEVFKDRLPGGVRTLAQILSIYGYRTAWFGPFGDPHLDPALGFWRGFEHVSVRPYVTAKEEAGMVCSWLEENKRRKFFLNFHTYRVHAPYCPEPEYRQAVLKGEKKRIIESREEYDRKLYSLLGRGPSGPEGFFMRGRAEDAVYWDTIDFSDPGFNAYVRGLYDACILEFDQEILRPIIGKLKALGLYGRTVIVVCADHGEAFYEHGDHGHGTNMYEPVIRVPLMIMAPGVAHRRVRELSSTVDIMPTILELAGIPVPVQAQGKSWAGCLTGRERVRPRHDYVFGQHVCMSYIRSKRWKLILDCDGKPELYDLRADPGELVNLAAKRRDISSAMLRRMREREAAWTDYREEVTRYPAETGYGTRERIRRTGYW